MKKNAIITNGTNNNKPNNTNGDNDAATTNTSSIYIRDDKHSWLPATISSTKGNLVTVTIDLPNDWSETTVHPTLKNVKKERTVNLLKYPKHVLPQRAITVGEDGEEITYADLDRLPNLNEASIFYNLKRRHAKSVPYTRVGNIVIAVNPFQWIDGLYSKETQEFYADRLVWGEKYYGRVSIEPHIYESSSRAYKGMAVDGENQTIITIGESGSGKTETIKIMVSHLAHIHSFRREVSSKPGDDAVVLKVLESNPLFEAFGNAQTIRNVNSSRFGKYTQLMFAKENPKSAKENEHDIPFCILAGAKREMFLLEKSRVVGHDPGERSYHIFYRLLAAPEEEKTAFWSGLANTTQESFSYVSHGAGKDRFVPDDFTDAASWAATVEDLGIFGVTGEDLITLMRGLCAVMQLGNLSFGNDSSGDEAAITSELELEKAADVLGIGKDVLLVGLTKRSMRIGHEHVDFALSSDAAKDSCDSLAKEIYSTLFDHLTSLIDRATDATKFENEMDIDRDIATGVPYFGVVNLVDIFGFEVFEVNRFEQLCINYVNEKMQMKFVNDMFSATHEEYKAEGIKLFDFSKVDNKPILDLIEGKTGLFSLLVDESIRPSGNDSSYVYKVNTMNSRSKHLEKALKHSSFEFCVKHFSGDVTYNAQKFVEKNTDFLPGDLKKCISQSTNKIIADKFKLEASVQSIMGVGGHKSGMIVNKIRTKLEEIIDKIKESKTHYIKCMKPNDLRKPLVFNHPIMVSQVQRSGIDTAVAILKETFPNSVPYEEFMDRFSVLSGNFSFSSLDDLKAQAEYLLELMLSDQKGNEGYGKKSYACGKTKIFFRTGFLEKLETDRLKQLEDAAVTLQRRIRNYLLRCKYMKSKNYVVQLQKWWRARCQRKKYIRILKCAIKIQTVSRRIHAKLVLQGIKKNIIVTKVQSRWRAYVERRKMKKFKIAARTIQKKIRRRREVEVVAKIDNSMRSVVNEALFYHRVEKFRCTLGQAIANDADDENHKPLLSQSLEIISSLENDKNVQRDVSVKIKEELKEEKAKKADLGNRLEILQSRSAAVTKETLGSRKKQEETEQQLLKCQAENKKYKKVLMHLHETNKERLTKEKEFNTNFMRGFGEKIKILKDEFNAERQAHAAEIANLKAKLKQAEKDHEDELQRVEENYNEMLMDYRNDLYMLEDMNSQETENVQIHKALDRHSTIKRGSIYDFSPAVDRWSH